MLSINVVPATLVLKKVVPDQKSPDFTILPDLVDPEDPPAGGSDETDEDAPAQFSIQDQPVASSLSKVTRVAGEVSPPPLPPPPPAMVTAGVVAPLNATSSM